MALIWPGPQAYEDPEKCSLPFTLNLGESDESFSRFLWFVESASVVNLASLGPIPDFRASIRLTFGLTYGLARSCNGH